MAAADGSPVRIRVPFAASSVALARGRLREWMADRGWASECVDNARLVMSELVANSVRHASPLPDGSILLTWCVAGEELVVSVTDGGADTQPHTVSASPTAGAGRGLVIIDSLARRWWAEHNRSDATVHACLHVA